MYGEDWCCVGIRDFQLISSGVQEAPGDNPEASDFSLHHQRLPPFSLILRRATPD